MIDFHPPPLTLCTGDGEFGVADQFLAADAVRMRRRDADCGADYQFASVDTEGMGERFLDKAGDVQRVAGTIGQAHDDAEHVAADTGKDRKSPRLNSSP